MVLDENTFAAIVEVVRNSALETCAMMCGEEPAIVECHEYSSNEGITGIISMFSDSTWSLMMSFPRDTSVAIAEKFCGLSLAYDSEDMADLVGEMANVLAGDVSARLDAMGIRAELSLPAVVRGKDVELVIPGSLPANELHLTCSSGDFKISIVVGGSHQIRKSGS